MAKEDLPKYDDVGDQDTGEEVEDEAYTDQPQPEELPEYKGIEEEDTGGEVPDEPYTDQPQPEGEKARPGVGSQSRKPGSPVAKDGKHRKHPSPNGIHATTGQPLVPPVSADQVADTVFRQAPPQRGGVRRVVPPDLDWNDLSQTGWGVILSENADPAIANALSELFKHRKSKAGWMFKRLRHEPGESASRFLARHQVGPDGVDPEKVPYYLLIVGAPEDVPFSFQYQLGVSYGVGRLHFDNLEDYSRYAGNVVRSETEGVSLPRIASLFGVERDPTTRRTTRELVAPLVVRLIRQTEDWRVRTWIREDATKARLRALLGGAETPGLLVTASHGVVYDQEDERQRERQGGLLCQDWPGPSGRKVPVASDHIFCAEDVSQDADLQGLFALLFACYSAGTPKQNDFIHENGPERIAPRDFVARLPQRLLRQGALGVIGHVDRAWTCTFSWTERGGQVETPAAVLKQLLGGHRAGHAMSYFGHRYAALATQLTKVWEEVRNEGAPSEDSAFLAWLWTAHNDARNMILLGDPAARRVEAKP